jgi:hypothetical protein
MSTVPPVGQKDVLVEAIDYLMRQDWYDVAGLLRHMELAFPDEYEISRRKRADVVAERDSLIAALEIERGEIRRLKEGLGV